ncbi:hypothetical protein RIF29_11185 [Crotalaria pallida]|uniref:Uncharacterized protein n=1 Tax=Crotalaria pallida TaxID=3830 RepID=A0AAN9ILW5_CROPI
MDKFVEDLVVNLDDDNFAYDESGGEEYDELGDKNGLAEVNASGDQYKRIIDLIVNDIWGLEFGSEEATYQFYSSNNVSMEDNGKTEQISTMNVYKNDKCSLRSNLDDNSKMDQAVLNEAITHVIDNLSKMVNSNLDFIPHTIMEKLANNLATSMNSLVTNQSQIDTIMEKLASPETLLGSPPLMRESTKDGNICPNFVSQLFSQDKEGKHFQFINYEPLNSCKLPRRTSGIEILEVRSFYMHLNVNRHDILDSIVCFLSVDAHFIPHTNWYDIR